MHVDIKDTIDSKKFRSYERRAPLLFQRLATLSLPGLMVLDKAGFLTGSWYQSLQPEKTEEKVPCDYG
jgi:hypothetical protein